MRVFAIPSILLATMLPASVKAEPVSVTAATAFESRYVFRGAQFAQASFQPGVQLGYKNFYSGAWFNLPIGDDDVAGLSGLEELDLYAGYSAALNDVITYDAGVTYYAYPELSRGFFDVFEEDGDGLGSNTIEAYAGLSFNTPLSPSIYAYRDFFLDTATLEGGVSHSFPLIDRTSLGIGGTIGYVIDDGPGDYLYGAITADIVYSFSERVSFSAGGRFSGSDIAGGAIVDNATIGSLQSSGFGWGVGFKTSF